MPGKPMKPFLDSCNRLIQSWQHRMGLQRLDQRGTVALSFAVAALPIALGVAAAIDFAGMIAGGGGGGAGRACLAARGR